MVKQNKKEEKGTGHKQKTFHLKATLKRKRSFPLTQTRKEKCTEKSQKTKTKKKTTPTTHRLMLAPLSNFYDNFGVEKLPKRLREEGGGSGGGPENGKRNDKNKG